MCFLYVLFGNNYEATNLQLQSTSFPNDLGMNCVDHMHICVYICMISMMSSFPFTPVISFIWRFVSG